MHPAASRPSRPSKPNTDQPREKLLQLGPASLTDGELLRILIGSGSAQASGADLADRLLERLGGLPAVLAAPAAQLLAIPGLGPAKVAAIGAAAESARRAADSPALGAPLSSPMDLAPWLVAHLAARPHEIFGAAFLDSRKRLIRIEELFRGSLTQTSIYPREVVSRALQFNAACLIIFHNHPSGLAQASLADIRLTTTLRSLLGQLDIQLLDHLLVAGHRVVSISG